MKKVLFLFWAFAASFATSVPLLRAQSLEPFSPYGIFSPSVEAWQMTRYGNLTPSLYTGAMTFSLPLYTYEDPDFTIPISLEYSFDGYRPGQHSGTVGYGWYLNCGGVITREVRGLPDEGDLDGNAHYLCLVRGWRQTPSSVRDSLYAKSGKIYSAHRTLLSYIQETAAQGVMTSYNPFSDIPAIFPSESQALGAGTGYDTAPDIYRFNFLGHSGAFTMLADGSVLVYGSDIPHGEIGVTFTDSYNDPAYVQIRITTGDGYSYDFATAGVNAVPDQLSAGPFRASRSVNEYILTKITAPNGRTVTFTNQTPSSMSVTRSYGTEGNVQYSVVTLHDNGDGGNSSGTHSVTNIVPWTVVQEHGAVPSRIAVSLDKDNHDILAAEIVLQYASASANEFAASCFAPDGPAAQYATGATMRLQSIRVLDREGKTAEEFTLTHHSHPSGTPKLFLDSVTSLRGGTHSFSYNLSGYTLPANDTQGTDHWGFWNGSAITDLRDHLTECSGTSHHLYDQMTDSVKEASFYHSSCGALTLITYPTGGTTQIGYEANSVRRRLNRHRNSTDITLEPADSSNASATWTVGGVRVKSLTDSDGSGPVRTTTLSYLDGQDRASGILMQMPRHCERVQYIHRVNSSFAQEGVVGQALVTLTSFSNSLFPLSGDAPVAYPEVKVTHPDGAFTRHAFTSVDQPSYIDGRSEGFDVTKHTACSYDWLETLDQGDIGSYLVPVTADRRAMRGKPLSEVTFDASGNEKHSIYYAYTDESATVPALCYNNLLCYNLTFYAAESPLLSARTETLHGMTNKTNYTYNSRGQRTCEEHIAGTGAGADTTRTTYTYLHESVDTTTLTSALSSATKARIVAGTAHVVAAENYAYGEWPVRGNAKPTSITRCAPPEGSYRTVTAAYDTLLHVKSLTESPGGSSIIYKWEGTHLKSRSDNGIENTTEFLWKDLVGPTRITAPSGQATEYGYDAKNRLRSVSDGKGRTLTVYNYRLKEE